MGITCEAHHGIAEKEQENATEISRKVEVERICGINEF